ncbi:MAG: DUF1775 domain-containing protein [Rhodospirillaceae bacterium]
MKTTFVTAALTALLFAAHAASAHVVVEPREAKAGEVTTYTVRIPSHLEASTIAVELEVPEDVEIVSIAKTALGHEVKKSPTGNAIIRWATDIPADERGEVTFVARNPAKDGEVAWKARQIYSNGETVDWVEPKGGKQPAAVTRILARENPR